MKDLAACLFFLFLCVACPFAHAQTAAPKLVTWQDLMQLPMPAPGQKIAYGKDSLQFGELRLPQGKGPFPVVVVIHGGCWLAQYNYQYMNHLSAALTKAGYATWNLEFRRVGNPGGGWPGTFLDVGQGVDFVKQLARQHPLNVKEVVVMGHSAGGHLALWTATRQKLPKESPLYLKKPLKVKGVVALAGIADLNAYATAPGSCNAAVPQLMGGLPDQFPDRYALGSPLGNLPLKVPVRLVQGDKDPIVPVSQAQGIARFSSHKQYLVQEVIVPNAGHFDLVAPTSPVWSTVEQAVKDVLRK
ncbi:alpha/beta hydrolase [Rufibacter sp. DG15C]|uniref:alpha/beta hydrolase n=1 Tax=Rufibacter sp. DG15C TaxID=1379909 RepID=UPI000A87A670|nr:alpha/beta hydrolase [Rufibacter sp. DG15C]